MAPSVSPVFDIDQENAEDENEVLFFEGPRQSLQLTVMEWFHTNNYLGIHYEKLVAFGSKGTRFELTVYNPNHI